MKLSVVVGTRDRLNLLRACIESVFEQTTTPLCVYVADAGSTDGTVEYLQSMASERLIPVLSGRRVGQARAYNDVFAQIQTPYVCWLSDDNVVVNRGLDLAVSILDRHPHIGMVGLKVKDVTGPFVDAPYIGAVSSIGALNVNQGMLRVAILKAVGGFSEAFSDYGIDPDLTARIVLSGHTVVYTRPIALHHFRNWSTDVGNVAYARQREKQEVYLRLYAQKYGHLGRGGLGWRLKRRLWAWAQRAFPSMALNSPRRVLGLLPRDWHNMFTGRYISLLDPVRCLGRPYHLVQFCGPTQRPKALPPDPVPRGAVHTISDP